MVAKKTSLTAALNEASGKKTMTTQQPSPAEEPENTASPHKNIPPSRRQTKAIGGHFDPAVSKELKRLAIDNNSTVQGLLAEALNDLFEKYGRKSIA